jgi:predicted naringenin-chalcone synthase
VKLTVAANFDEVLFVLRKILDEAKPAPGQKGLLLSFGAGFTAFAALVEF